MPKKPPQKEIMTTPRKSPHTKPSTAELAPEVFMPDIDWEKVLASEGNKDFYTTIMYQGKPLKILVATEEVKIKKEKSEKIECPIAQSSEKEDKDTDSDRKGSDLSLNQSSFVREGEKKMVEIMNPDTTGPSVSDTEMSGSKNETKNESNTEKQSESENVEQNAGKESDNKGTDDQESNKGKESDSDRGNNAKGKNEGKESVTESDSDSPSSQAKESASEKERKAEKVNNETEDSSPDSTEDDQTDKDEIKKIP